MENKKIVLQETVFKAPSWERYKVLARKIDSISLTRALQYEVLENYSLKGDVLDFGGGEKSKYRELLNCNSYKSVNIDKDIEPTWLVEVGSEMPCEDKSFDTVLSMNTLEHIYDAKSVVKDIYRVLRDNGEAIFFVPFLFPIHGHPDDYFRPTPSWFTQTFIECGFKEMSVTPLSWGPLTIGQVCAGTPGPFKVTRKRISLALDLAYYKLSCNRRSEQSVNETLERFATGFFARAIK